MKRLMVCSEVMGVCVAVCVVSTSVNEETDGLQ